MVEQSAPAVWEATTDPVRLAEPDPEMPPPPLAVTVLNVASTEPALAMPAPLLAATVASCSTAKPPEATSIPVPLPCTEAMTREPWAPSRTVTPVPRHR